MALSMPGAARVGTAEAGATPRGRAGGHQARAASGFLALSMAGFLAFTILPIIGSLVMAFFDWPVFGDRTFSGLANCNHSRGAVICGVSVLASGL